MNFTPLLKELRCLLQACFAADIEDTIPAKPAKSVLSCRPKVSPFPAIAYILKSTVSLSKYAYGVDSCKRRITWSRGIIRCMYQDTYQKILDSAQAKLAFFKRNQLGFWAAAALAGIYVGFGVVAYSIPGAAFAGLPGQKLLMGAVFSVALTLVIFAGAELFTGNNLVLSLAWLGGKAKAGQVLPYWGICYLGNLLGSILFALLLHGSGFLKGDYGLFVAQTALTKISYPPLELILRSMLCNLLVCLAVWCSYRLQSDSGKFIAIMLCVGTFVAAGFEHVVANMTLLTAAVLNPHGLAIPLSGVLYNLVLSGLGNLLGAFLLLALPYWLTTRKSA